jgi:hypothetical protein
VLGNVFSALQVFVGVIETKTILMTNDVGFFGIRLVEKRTSYWVMLAGHISGIVVVNGL